jgi:hypothetical protein
VDAAYSESVMSGAAPLSATSALVLLWSGPESYSSREARRYLELLDLGAGIPLHERCSGIWPHYGEVIKNRKHCIMELMEQCAEADGDLRQVVVLGAGLAPLGVEWKARHPSAGVFDLDGANMELKRRLVSSLEENTLGGMNFIRVDLGAPGLVGERLVEHGWNRQEPTLLVLEGISYYLRPDVVRQLVLLFRHPERRTRAIVEYLKPVRAISAERRRIPGRVFGVICDTCGHFRITRFSGADIASWPAVELLTTRTMSDIERARTGGNEHFPSDESGWIELSMLAL